jgi:hypothetical protein
MEGLRLESDFRDEAAIGQVCVGVQLAQRKVGG